MFLMKQYAVEHSKDGIRFNGVNADRIEGGLLTPDMIAKESKIKRFTVQKYISGNILNLEVRAMMLLNHFII